MPTVRIDWRGFRHTLALAFAIAAMPLPLVVLAGIVRGLPWPPRVDDFTFAMAAYVVVIGGIIFVRQAGGDLIAAWRKAHAIEAQPPPLPQEQVRPSCPAPSGACQRSRRSRSR
jgi:hypothetical protein